MGTRTLGSRPWLVADDAHDQELALKAQLCTERHAEVFQALPGSEPAGRAVAALLQQASVRLQPEAGLHPLERAGRSVQEDLCLLNRRPDGWYLVGASLCFPSRWRLADKINRHITEVHGPVRDYQQRLSGRVDRVFDRLTPNPVWRRNWFVHPDPALFQPTRPKTDTLITADRALGSLYVRSERQTLRSIDPSGWLLFTIKTQQVPVSVLAADASLAAAFARYLSEAPADDLAGRGIALAQTGELLLALEAA